VSNSPKSSEETPSSTSLPEADDNSGSTSKSQKLVSETRDVNSEKIMMEEKSLNVNTNENDEMKGDDSVQNDKSDEKDEIKGDDSVQNDKSDEKDETRGDDSVQNDKSDLTV
jgi:hypothetical protein